MSGRAFGVKILPNLHADENQKSYHTGSVGAQDKNGASRVPVETVLLLVKGKETKEEEDVCKRKSRRGGAAKWN